MRKKPRVVVVGSGIIGASVAFSCLNLGAEVVVLEQNKLGGAASSSSFGWINASFAETPAYFKLRNAAVHAFRNLKEEIDLNDSVRWRGTLWWEDSGLELKKQFSDLVERGYTAKLLNCFLSSSPLSSHHKVPCHLTRSFRSISSFKFLNAWTAAFRNLK